MITHRCQRLLHRRLMGLYSPSVVNVRPRGNLRPCGDVNERDGEENRRCAANVRPLLLMVCQEVAPEALQDADSRSPTAILQPIRTPDPRGEVPGAGRRGVVHALAGSASRASSLAAASFCIVGRTCEYVVSVMEMFEWPSIFCTTRG